MSYSLLKQFKYIRINKLLRFSYLMMSSNIEENTGFKIRAVNNGFDGFDKEKEAKWVSPFFFIQAADTQFGMIDDLANKPKPGWEAEIKLTRKSIEKANLMNPKPKFFIVCGDLVDAMPGEPEKEPQIADFKLCFKDLSNDIPLVCVCGNHDVGDTPTLESINAYRKTFGHDYFSFPCGGVLFIVINSQYYKDSSLVKELAKEQEEWLDQVLLDAKSGKYKHVVVFQHIPWFLRHPDEEDEYFNIENPLRETMLSKFYSAGVRTIMCGHYHRNAGGMYKDLELVVTSAIGAQLGDDESGFRIVKCLENGIKHDYYSIDDAPLKIDL